jgi:hypothetical protein
MTWADPISDLRDLLNDDTNGNLIKYKVVFPIRTMGSSGLHRTFMTLEDRLVAPLGSQANIPIGPNMPLPLRVFLEDPTSGAQTEVAASGIMLLDDVRGEFQLSFYPSGVSVRASYYFRQWLDEELNTFINQATLQCNGTDPTQIPDGLQLAVLNIAGSLAHRRAAGRWLMRKSEQFMLEEPQTSDIDLKTRIDFHQSQAKDLYADGMTVRQSFYNLRMDRGLAPAFGVLNRIPRPYTPRR